VLSCSTFVISPHDLFNSFYPLVRPLCWCFFFSLSRPPGHGPKQPSSLCSAGIITTLSIPNTENATVSYPDFLFLTTLSQTKNSSQFGRFYFLVSGFCAAIPSTKKKNSRIFKAYFAFALSPPSNTKNESNSTVFLSCLCSSPFTFVFSPLDPSYPCPNTKNAAKNRSHFSCLGSSLRSLKHRGQAAAFLS